MERQTRAVEIMKRPCFCHTVVTMMLFLAFPANATEAKSTKGVVASDHVLASQIGAKVLEDGGNAVDAGVATLLMLGLVNPFASGIGGGGFCLYQPTDGEAAAIDFRETAPAKAFADMYVRDGKTDIMLTLQGGLAVATPAEVAGLWAIHERYGALPWKDVVMRVETVAREGHRVGPLMEKRLQWRPERLDAYPDLKNAFSVKGRFLKEGDDFRNLAFAKLLKKIAEGGPEVFYSGEVAEAMVKRVQSAGGVLELEDLKNYKPVWRKPVRGTYRGYEVIGMPPPSSGGIATIQVLNILEAYDLRTLGQSAIGVHVIVEALKHAFADRARYLGDDDFVEVPMERLISKDYARTQQQKVVLWKTLSPELYGDHAPPPDDSGTSHISVADRSGNMLACTSTVNTIFGSLVYIPEWGFVMNNQMADFTAQAGVPNNYGLVGNAQNAVAAGKRPLSSMTPTIIRKDGKSVLAVGASGGPTIITGTILGIIRLLDFGLTPDAAVSLPRFHHQWMPDSLTMEEISDAEKAVLTRLGHAIQVRAGHTAVQIVSRQGDVFIGASDPRKNGEPWAATK